MKKKPVLIVLSLVLGSSLLCATAFASLSSSAGYDVYKAAVKNLAQADSMSFQAKVSVLDNGSVILNADSTEKMDRNDRTMSSTSTIIAGDKTQSSEVYHQQDQTVIKNSDSDVYNVITRDGSKASIENNGDKKIAHEAVAKDVENIIDLIASNFDGNIALEQKADGSQEVTLNLADGQITPLENAVASLIVKNAAREGERGPIEGAPTGNLESIIKTSVPQLVDAISLKSIDLKAHIDAQGQLTDQTAALKVSGTDAAGQAHEVIVNVEVNLSAINSTTPDTVDLTGKQVNTTQAREFKGHSLD